jgi:hypothetical protein
VVIYKLTVSIQNDVQYARSEAKKWRTAEGWLRYYYNTQRMDQQKRRETLKLLKEARQAAELLENYVYTNTRTGWTQCPTNPRTRSTTSLAS